jgi:hypothetical protein
MKLKLPHIKVPFVATREQMITKLNKAYPTLFIKTTEEFNGGKGGIWSSAESGVTAKDGHRLFNYNAVGKKYDSGVHKAIGNLLEKNGWYAEWYDCGTIMFWLV